MQRAKNLLIIILLLAILMIITNPDQEDFINWAIEQEETDTALERKLGDVIKRPLLTLATSREDYILFSIFTIQETGEKTVYLGIFQNGFIRIPFM
ncbi:MAG: hypothetical protein ACOCRO_06995 [Halanaerobiales bacterium]